jgi:methylmalonyl-CoA/ethylmalonyl-CoA epimerase
MLPYFRFHHIGIAVFDIDKTAWYYIGAGYTKTETIFDPIQNVYICFLKKESMPMVELLTPKDASSPVSKTLQKSDVTPYHNCYEVDDIENAIRDLKKLRFVSIIKPVKACVIDNKRVCFLFNKDIGLIELVEA